MYWKQWWSKNSWNSFIWAWQWVCSYTICVVLAVIALTVSIGIATYFDYYKYMDHNKKTASRYDYVYQASNY